MGADTKALRARIKSVDSTLHLTKAMGLVASSKIRRANEAMFKGREYAAALEGIVRVLTASPECAKSPYLNPGADGKTLLVVIAGDRGLAGGYNANIFRLLASLDFEAEIYPIGKRACDRFGEGSASSEHFGAREADTLAKELCARFAAGELSRVGIVDTRYVSMMTQEARLSWVLPLTAEEDVPRHGVLFEPDERTVLDAAVPEYVGGRIAAAVRESFACEVAARRMAMDSAGKNAKTMIDDLTLAYNRARQSSITQEITEIVAGGGS